MFVEVLRQKIKEATLAKDNDTKSILKVALGEIERSQKVLSDEKAYEVIGKIIQNNKDAIRDGANSEKLEAENILLSSLLPATMTKEEIATVLQGNEAILSAPNDGKATGVAMGLIKKQSNGKIVNGGDVSEVVKQIRSRQ